jgi:hypothetical protein
MCDCDCDACLDCAGPAEVIGSEVIGSWDLGALIAELTALCTPPKKIPPAFRRRERAQLPSGLSPAYPGLVTGMI